MSSHEVCASREHENCQEINPWKSYGGDEGECVIDEGRIVYRLQFCHREVTDREDQKCGVDGFRWEESRITINEITTGKLGVQIRFK